jgi:hypothetical protein
VAVRERLPSRWADGGPRQLLDPCPRGGRTDGAGAAGADRLHEQFQDVLRIACDHGGASGFIAGRAIWQEAVGMDRQARRTFLRETGRRRLDACVKAIQGRARPYWRV